MTDPEHGSKPSEGGASAATRGEGKPSRRRKGKRGGENRGAAPAAVDAGSGDRPGSNARTQSPASGGQQISADGGEPHLRKRKRRRRSKARATAGHAPHGAAHDSVAGQSPAAAGGHDGASDGKNASRDGEKASPGKGKNRNRRRRGSGNKRGPQGRPMAPGGGRHAPLMREDAQVKERAETRQDEARNPASREAVHASTPFVPNDLYAALDLGTNNCRLLIAQPTRPGQFRVVDAFSRIVRLGEGLGASGRLSDDAMDRAVEALRVCAAKLEARRIRRMRLIATEACRAAGNGEAFLERVTRETGLRLEIIDRETEARLAVSGCASLVEADTRSVVLFDIGGGSSEIAVIRLGRHRDHARLANNITHWTSLPVGVVTLSERHGGRDVTPAVFDSMVEEVAAMLARFDCPPVPGAEGGAIPEDFHLLGTSGTVTTLAGVHLGLSRYDRRRVDGVWLSDAEVTAMQAQLLSWDFAGRAANPCIGPDRADLVLAGCAILEAIRRRWPSRRMRVADRGLREGLLTDMMTDDGVWRRSGRHRRGTRGKQGERAGS